MVLKFIRFTKELEYEIQKFDNTDSVIQNLHILSHKFIKY